MSRPAILVVCLLGACGGGSEILHGLDERQANEVVAELDRGGIDAEKLGDEGAARFKVSVQRSDRDRAHDLLAARDLPRRGARGVGEAFADPGLFPSPQAERARLGASIAADLERTLEAIPGVSAARVHLALPDDDLDREPGVRARITAAVLLRTRGALVLSSDELRTLVSSAVSGLDAGDVSLSFAPEASADPSADPSLGPSANRAPPRERLVRLGPLALAPSSRGPALSLAAVALGFLVALGATALALYLRLRALEKPGDPLA